MMSEKETYKEFINGENTDNINKFTFSFNCYGKIPSILFFSDSLRYTLIAHKLLIFKLITDKAFIWKRWKKLANCS